MTSYTDEDVGGAEGYSVNLQNTPPAHFDVAASSSVATAEHSDEECNLLGVDVSVPPTGEGVTGEDDVQHGEVSTHTESNSAGAGEFPGTPGDVRVFIKFCRPISLLSYTLIFFVWVPNLHFTT